MNAYILSKIKIKLLLCLIFTCISLSLYAQVGINTISPKATLEIQHNPLSNNAPGIIVPKVKTSDLVNFVTNGGQFTSDHIGIMTYIIDADVDVTQDNISLMFRDIKNPGYYFFDGTTFIGYAASAQFSHISQPWYSETTNLGATSVTENIYQEAQVGIGKSGVIDPNAQLEITSTDKGILIPRLSRAQRDAITTPSVSMLIWNTDELCLNFYKGDTLGWKSICENNIPAEFTITNCSSSLVQGTYVVGTATDNSNYIQLNVNVTKKGEYNIEATTSIGLYFQKNGTFPAEGNYTIIIPGYGSPTVATEDIVAPLTDEAAISINGEDIICSVQIPVIKPATVKYSINTASTESITKGVSIKGHKLVLDLNVLVAGTSNMTATDKAGLGLTFKAYNQILKTETDGSPKQQNITLYAEEGTVPSTFSGSSLDFELEGLGQDIAQTPYDFSVPIISNEAIATCSSIVLEGDYVARKSLNTNHFITVTVDVTSPGSYNFYATNAATNITYSASGGFTKTGSQSFIAKATTISNTTITENIGSYNFTSTFNTNPFCTFNVDVIYPATNVLLYTPDANQMKSALTPSVATNNFAPKGKFKTEALNLIYDASSWTLSSATLLNYINNQNVQIIIIPSRVIIPDDAQQVLANFINKKNGLVFFTGAGTLQQATILESLIQKTYPTSGAVVNPNNFGGQYLQAMTLSGDNDNPYINGPFGNVLNKFFLTYHYNITPDIVLSGSSTVLKSLVSLPNAPLLTARNAFVYSDTPGLFILPGDTATLGNANTLYGNYSPIQANTQAINAFSYNGVATSTNQYPVQTLTPGLVINWVLFGNIMAEYIKYSYNNYNDSIVIDRLP
ncbi:hypothetical protein K5I29_05155 [Flavobacterium agricola]|uniref:Uncharacterized protein n=1 Tax=Flavobacterium agricola TaxID=2870839 RepID=A0ABY6M401_9FLAO|nr:hypothetical protein [Flavobacterium agricola]UYW02290.1 hypothetical protein K5I29_05155 [Flavobacterium agricola]